MAKVKPKFNVPIILAMIALCCACAGAASILLYFSGDALLSRLGIPNPVDNSQPVVSAPTETPQPEVTTPPPTEDTSNLPEWTVLVYSAADDEGLEEYMVLDINEMELVGSNPQMNIVVQMDRYEGAYDGDGDWTDARRYLITQDNDLYSPSLHLSWKIWARWTWATRKH